MGFLYMEIEGDYNYMDSDEDENMAFIKKHNKIIELFEGDFFRKDENGATYPLILPTKSIIIDSRNFSRHNDLEINKERARARFFSNIKESECAPEEFGNFGFGTTGFPDEFYTDLFNLGGTSSGNSWHWQGLEVDCGQSGGYYSGGFTLMENGLAESFTFYEED